MKTRKLVFASAAVFSSFMSTAIATPNNEATNAFNALIDEHWQVANKEQIFFRKDPDAFRTNGALPDMSQQGRDRREKYNQELLNRLDKIDVSTLSANDQVTYRLFKYERQTEAKSYLQLDHFYPVNYYSGFDSYFAAAPGNMSFLSKNDYDKYLISLAGYPKYSQDHINDLRGAVKLGHVHYCDSFQHYAGNIKKLIVDDATSSPFYQPFANMPDSISNKAEYQAKAKALISEKVIPEYQKFYDFFTKDYMTKCRNTVAISELPGGADYYQYLIEFYTTTDMSADEIHQIGLDEVKRIKGEMEVIMRQVGFKGDLKAFIDYLRNEPKFYAQSEMEIFEKASYITRKMAAQLPKWFSVLPRQTFDIKSAPNGGAYYVASDGSGTTSGTYFLETKELSAQPLYTLEALTFHEAEPGHHLQSAIAQEVDMAEFRKTLYHAAYGEGWGLYSERLGKEIGFYQDPYSDFGRLTYEAWRAGRLVVDTGLHAKGWSRQQAIDYLADNTALSMPDVVAQIDRYISWPAQALSYKIGEIKIRELRALAEKELGDKFNIRLFHDQMLKNGSLPLALLEELTHDWIAEQKK